VFAGREHAYICVEPLSVARIAALTDAEREVARLAASGSSNAAIARCRKVSPQTVANQLSSIYRKLGVASRIELAARLW
jgi:DNA-binding CsgD family transcriptional regulator